MGSAYADEVLVLLRSAGDDHRAVMQAGSRDASDYQLHFSVPV